MPEFFNHQHYLEYLVNEALPELIRSHGYGLWKKLVVWSPRCYSGEGSYTLAIVLTEFAERYPGLGFDFIILATDELSETIDVAKCGTYAEETINGIPLALRKKYLLKSKDRSKKLIRIAPELKEVVRFRTGDLLQENLKFREPIDIIYCPDIQINVPPDLISGLFAKFYRYLSPGGYLFFGYPRIINKLNVPLAQVAPRIYRKLSH